MYSPACSVFVRALCKTSFIPNSAIWELLPGMIPPFSGCQHSGRYNTYPCCFHAAAYCTVPTCRRHFHRAVSGYQFLRELRTMDARIVVWINLAYIQDQFKLIRPVAHNPAAVSMHKIGESAQSCAALLKVNDPTVVSYGVGSANLVPSNIMRLSCW